MLFSFEAQFNLLAICQLYRKENFEQENFGESVAVCQIRYPPELCIIWYPFIRVKVVQN